MATGQVGLNIRYNESLHRKLKVIAAYKGKSLNGLMNEMFSREVSDWEQEHGEIEFPE